MNREMLKECIADAKTIKETAIANAKVALEEAFTPQLTAMFAEKLNELDNEEVKEEESMEENYSTEEGIEETFNIDEILAELEMTDEGEKMEEDMDSMDEDLMLEEMSDEDIEALVTQVIDDMIASGKLMAGEESEEEMDMDDMDMEDEEEMEEEEIDEDINLEELLAEMDSEEEKPVKEATEWVSGYLSAPEIVGALGIAASIVGISASDYIKAAIKRFGEKGAKEKIDKVLKDDGVNPPTQTTEATNKEMEKTINELRNELNEVNLLNAKLLYTNKIFKAKNLTESEKVKVLNTFDKAETVKGVKLVYETLIENLKSTSIVKKSPVKESLGSASRAITPATPKQPIVEVNEAFARMQKIAGIRK